MTIDQPGLDPGRPGRLRCPLPASVESISSWVAWVYGRSATSTNMRTRSAISLATRRKASSCSASVPSAFDGSSSVQWSVLTAPGNTGQVWRAVSHTVMTHCQGCPRNSLTGLLCWPLMSMPLSAITVIASWRTSVISVPALATS